MLLPASLQRKRKRQEIPKPTLSTTHQNAEAGPSSSVPRRASTELENEQQARSCGDQATDGPVSSSKKVKQETQQASPAAGWQEWYRDEPTKRQVILRWLATSLLVIAQDEAVKQRDSKGKGKARAADGSDDSGCESPGNSFLARRLRHPCSIQLTLHLPGLGDPRDTSQQAPERSSRSSAAHRHCRLFMATIDERSYPCEAGSTASRRCDQVDPAISDESEQPLNQQGIERQRSEKKA